jgi:2-polyprenyl-6-methoxyphenol hydroxylase-like FAD-dependent oxidoreductase
MRILIVGAGIGGMTLSALLEHRGLIPQVIERSPSYEQAGYMLGLYALGSRVLHGLGLYRSYAEASVEATRYEVRDDRGELIKSWPLDLIADRWGPILSSTRPDLIEVLRTGLRDTTIRFGTALEYLEQASEEVHVVFGDGSTGDFDLVVGADGMHSRVRTVTFGEQSWYHTGWGGWVWWAKRSPILSGNFLEYWGTGRFLGAYSTCRGVGVFAGAPVADGFDQPGPGRRERLQNRFAGLGDSADALLDELPDDEAEMYFWKLSDVRSAEWACRRVVLLGDAAAGFLPTAGVGASMAMESAAVLNDELSRTDNRFLEHTLMLYVKRRKQRVERIQSDSRKLARMMFVSSQPMARIRNFVLRFYSLQMLAKNIAKAFDEPL